MIEPEERLNRAQAAIIDALAPICGPAGIAGMCVVALVAVSENEATPIRIVLGVSPEANAFAMDAACKMAATQYHHTEENHFTVNVSGKN